MTAFGSTYPPPKDPNATLDYGFDWTAWLQSGETITEATITVPSGISKTQQQIVGDVVVFWLAGGIPNNSYTIACEITTSQGRTDSRSFSLFVAVR